jgi:hypothetical protein
MTKPEAFRVEWDDDFQQWNVIGPDGEVDDCFTGKDEADQEAKRLTTVAAVETLRDKIEDKLYDLRADEAWDAELVALRKVADMLGI